MRFSSSGLLALSAFAIMACDRTPSYELPDDLVVPTGMILIPGGETLIGDNNRLGDEGPPFEASVPPFFLDEHPVTVADFRAFVEATDFVTQAERFGDAGIMEDDGVWRLISEATWHHPLGPEAQAAPNDHPVTQVSWNDAIAYAGWAGKRLPTEVEWEHAARGGTNSRDRYSWGEELVIDGVYQANTWTGSFPVVNTVEDGFKHTAPVGEFGITPLGLTDMGGNIWEWTSDWYRPYAVRSTRFEPDETSEKSQRGGSFLCHTSYCHGYRVSARSHSTPETALFHVGFRLAKDVE
jgi:sulfatase modifying factor 1